MTQHIAAVYENGVFRPQQPPQLADGEHVRLTIHPLPDDSEESHEVLDFDQLRFGAGDEPPTISREALRAAMSKIRGSMDDAVSEQRGDY